MTFIHDDPAFSELLRLVASAHGMSSALVEMDYRITHALWSREQCGESLWVTGALSLHSGFRLLRRLPEPTERDLAVAERVSAIIAQTSVVRPATSLVHDELALQGLSAHYDDNRPRTLRCEHPLVSLLRKLNALAHALSDSHLESIGFVHHFNDCAQIIAARKALPPLPATLDVRTLASHLLTNCGPDTDLIAFARQFLPDASQRWRELRSAHRALSAMVWGPRQKLADECAEIHAWICGHSQDDESKRAPLSVRSYSSIAPTFTRYHPVD